MEIIFVGVDGKKIAEAVGEPPNMMDKIEFTKGIQSTATSFHHIKDKTKTYMVQGVKRTYLKEYREMNTGVDKKFKSDRAIVTLMPLNES